MSAHPKTRRRSAGSAWRGGLALVAAAGRAGAAARVRLPPRPRCRRRASTTSAPPTRRRSTAASGSRPMANAGFETVLNYTAWYGSAEEVQESCRPCGRRDQGDLAAQRPRLAGRHGSGRLLQVLGPDCGCDTNPEFKQFALGLGQGPSRHLGLLHRRRAAPHLRERRGWRRSTRWSRSPRASPPCSSSSCARPGRWARAVPGRRRRRRHRLLPDRAGAQPEALSEYRGRNRAITPSTARTGMVLQAFSWAQYYPQTYPSPPSRPEARC